MRALLLLVMLLVCFSAVLVPLAVPQSLVSTKASLAKHETAPNVVLVNLTVKPNDPGSGGGGQGVI